MSEITMRPYTDADYDMLCEWSYGHGKVWIPQEMISKCGVVCEIDARPVSALFLHMDNSCGMCMADHAVSVPGLSLKTALLAFRHCVSCLKKIARDLGYHTMAIFTYPAAARFLERQGFRTSTEGLVQLFAPTKEDE